MGLSGLAVVVLPRDSSSPMGTPEPAGDRAAWRPDAMPLPSLDPDEAHVGVIDEPVEDAHGVGAAADARQDRIREAAGQART